MRHGALSFEYIVAIVILMALVVTVWAAFGTPIGTSGERVNQSAGDALDKLGNIISGIGSSTGVPSIRVGNPLFFGVQTTYL